MTKSSSPKVKKASVATAHKKAKFSSSAAIMKDPFNVMPMTTKLKKTKKQKKSKAAATATTKKSNIIGNNSGSNEKKMKKKKVSQQHLQQPTKKKNKKNKEEVKMVWSLPCESTMGISLESMPWCHFTTEPLELSTANYCNNNKMKTNFPPLLQKMFQNTRWMALLTLELKLFGQYVRLTNMEIEARHHVVKIIEALCQSNLKQASQSQPINIRVFGSFASLDVCTYASDVDISVWGAVEPPTQPLIATTTTTTSVITTSDESSSTPALATKQKHKLQRWREALAHINFTASQPKTSTTSNGNNVIDLTKDGDQDEEKKKESPLSTTSNANNIIDLTKVDDQEEEVKEESPLFIIDRKGQTLEEIGLLSSSTSTCNPTTSCTTVTTVTVSTSDEEEKEEEEGSKYSRSRNAHNNDQITINNSTNKEEVSDEDDADPLKRFHPLNATKKNHQMEVGFIWLPPPQQHQQQQQQKSIQNNNGMSNKSRKKVLSALYRISSALRRHPILSGDNNNYTPKMEVRRFAKVPILAFETSIGVEGDVAIGDGHNGTDTSAYASTMMKRYRSFAPVVLLLKILLKQANLDKPFTGGLGSYKLYVLVAYHLERHVDVNGGNDNPSEVLLAFLYRYSGSYSELENSTSTPLRPTSILSTSDGGLAEMQPVFRLAECEKLFQVAFQRLITFFEKMSLKIGGEGEESSSIMTVLGIIICASTLDEEREDKLEKARNAKEYIRSSSSIHYAQGWSQGSSTTISSTTTSHKVSMTKTATRSHHFFTKDIASSYLVETTGSSRSKKAKKNNNKHVPEEENTDDEQDRLMAGYGMQRGDSGSILPKKSKEKKRKSIVESPTKKTKKSKKRKEICSF